MRARSLLTLLIGLPLACAALVFLDQRLGEREAARLVAASSTLALATVVVAAQDLAPGDLLQAAVLKELAWPVDSVPEGAFATIEELLGAGRGEARARHAILMGEPVLATKLSRFRGGDTPDTRDVTPARRQKLALARRAGNLGGGYP